MSSIEELPRSTTGYRLLNLGHEGRRARTESALPGPSPRLEPDTTSKVCSVESAITGKRYPVSAGRHG